MIVRRIRTDHDGVEIPGHAVFRHDDVNVSQTENGLILVFRGAEGTGGPMVCIGRPQKVEKVEDVAYFDMMVEIKTMPGCYQREAWRVTE